MEEIAVSKFKSQCLSVVERVRKTKKPIRLTRYGKVVAELVPAASAKSGTKNGFGSMAGTVLYMGDIVSPTTDAEDWSRNDPLTRPE